MKNNNEIRSQFCTCHDSSAVVTCANLRPDWIMRIMIKAKELFTRDFSYELIDCLWTGSRFLSTQHSLPGTTVSTEPCCNGDGWKARILIGQHKMHSTIGHVTLVAITGITILVPYHKVQLKCLIWRLGTPSFHPWVPDLQIDCISPHWWF